MEVDYIMIDNRICTRSINVISYLCYCNSQQAEIVENETGLRMWSVMDNEVNREIYNKYKNAVNGDGNKLFVDLVKFNNIARYLKNMSKNYKCERVD
jgi:hypothetical protein